MRIVLDVSTAWNCRGSAVGIVRTEREFAEFLLAYTDLDVAFCRFEPEGRRHVEVTRGQLREALGGQPVGPNSTAPAPPVRREPLKESLLQAGHSVGMLLPQALRPATRSVARSAWRVVRTPDRLARGLLRRVRDGSRKNEERPPQGQPEEPKSFTFRPVDVYISVGSDWLFNDLDAIARARREVGFGTVLFCYDTIPVRFPHLMNQDFAHRRFEEHLLQVGWTADRIVAISHASRDDLKAFLEGAGLPVPPVDVVHLGTDLSVDEAEVRPPPGFPEGPHVLCVGTIEPRKNHEVLYQAWDRLVAKHGDRVPRLVMAGGIGWGVSDLIHRIRANPRTRDAIWMVHGISDGQLIWLYRNALFAVYPSFYEGWGLPVAEALSMGRPCITSDAPAVVEASQGMSVAIDPIDGPAWVAAIERLWLDEQARDRMARDVRENFRTQRWHEHGEAMVRVARAVYGRRSPAHA
jgi:glycosyltransferase involved in cell wall biosynthesis